MSVEGGVATVWSLFHLPNPSVSFLEWYGAYQSEDIASCTTTLQTRVSDNASQWRSVAYDPTNAVVYFCDPRLRREVKGLEMACFSSTDGTTWAGETKTEIQGQRHSETNTETQRYMFFPFQLYRHTSDDWWATTRPTA